MENNFDGVNVCKELEERMLTRLRAAVLKADANNMPALATVTLTFELELPALIVRMAEEQYKQKESP